MIERAGSEGSRPRARLGATRRRDAPLRDVLIVGAGAAGVGVGAALRHLGIDDFAILDRDGVGSSFARWPREMRFITPSFPSNAFGQLDLNAVAPRTSPALHLGVEHPTGVQYAGYLQAVAAHFELPVESGVEVHGVEVRDDEAFDVATSRGDFGARCVVWAAGEFGCPRLDCFPGAEHALHSSRIGSYAKLAGDSFVVVGGGESGVDAAFHLHAAGRRVTLVERSPSLGGDSEDPSTSLSPVSKERLTILRRSPRAAFFCGRSVVGIDLVPRGWLLRCEPGAAVTSRTRPILATGFHGSHALLRELFEAREDGFPLLTEQDESTLASGLFLSGPTVRHEDHVFCFIYKFRQRFAVVAAAIAERLGVDASPLEAYRAAGMYLDDLRCCGESCDC